VIRTTDRGQQTIAVDMNDIIRRGQREKAIRLLENDVIVVKGWILDVVMNGVNLKRDGYYYNSFYSPDSRKR